MLLPPSLSLLLTASLSPSLPFLLGLVWHSQSLVLIVSKANFIQLLSEVKNQFFSALLQPPERCVSKCISILICSCHSY